MPIGIAATQITTKGSGGGGTPGGSSGQLQWNNSLVFAGIAGSSANTDGNVTLAPPATGTALAVTCAPDGTSFGVTISSAFGNTCLVTPSEATDDAGTGNAYPEGYSYSATLFGTNVTGDGAFGCQGSATDSSTGGAASEITSGYFQSIAATRSLLVTNIHLGSILSGPAVSQAALLIDSQSGSTAIETDNADPSFFGPISPGQFTVAGLPSGVEGQMAYATNGRKVGELSGAGTGVPVYFSNSLWRVFSTDTQVQS